MPFYKSPDGKIKPFELKLPRDAEVEWPSKLLTEKPGLTRRSFTPNRKENAFQITATIFIKSLLTPELALAYLHTIAKELKLTLETDWISYKLIIGQAGSIIDPFSLIKEIGEEEIDLSESQIKSLERPVSISNTRENRYKLATLLLAVYRIGKASITRKPDFYRDRLFATLMSSTSFAEFPNIDRSMLEQYVYWVKISDYRKTLAMYDMFLSRANRKDLSYMRVGTLVTAYEDCHALNFLLDFRKILHVTLEELASLILYRPAFIEFDKMYRTDEEITKEHSYLPYCRSFEIVNRSPWSVTANRNLFTFFAALGTVRLDPRSYNANAQEVFNFGIFEIAVRVDQALEHREEKLASTSMQDEEKEEFLLEETKIDRVMRNIKIQDGIDLIKLGKVVKVLRRQKMREKSIGEAFIGWAITLGVMN